MIRQFWSLVSDQTSLNFPFYNSSTDANLSLKSLHLSELVLHL